MSTQNFEFGRGKLFIALESDGFTNPAYRYLGQTPGFTLTMTPERIDLKSSDGPSRETIASVVIENEIEGSLSCHNVSQENLALFLSGEEELISQSAGSISFALANIKQGFDYFLGETATDIDFFRDVASVAVSGAVAGTDFTVDAALGLISIVRGSSVLEDGDNITVTGSKPAREFTRVSSSNQGEVRCRLRFIADNAHGANRRLTLPLVSMAPSGDYMPQSEDDFVSLDFDFTVLKTSLERVIIDGVATEPA